MIKQYSYKKMLKCVYLLLCFVLFFQVFLLLFQTYPKVANLYSNEGQDILIKKEEFDIINYSNNKNDFLHIERNKLTLIGDNQIEQEINLNMDIDIWFNIEKISNAIKCIESEEINIRYLGSLKPLTINNEIMVLPVRK